MSSSKPLESLTQAFLSRPVLIKTLHASTIVSLSMVTGIAASLHTWVIPMLLQAHSTKTKLSQFHTIIDLGYRYLQPLSRVIGIILALLAFVTSRSDNPVASSRAKYFAAAFGSVMAIAPYEAVMIFPINDRLFEVEEELRREGKEDRSSNLDAERDREVDRLLRKWRMWHTGRVVIPLISSVVLAWGAVDLFPS